ncbi:GGDEF domain-containing protein [uncultured Azonexus sp.]|uniref:GGDEF domain-containing protein n=1 Tax=uncultured Azonexus sp. TaxID=520307 RepID=UPI00261B8FBA|nr:GGDEF domain-containing protein [uncultured Azonexus sp.]
MGLFRLITCLVIFLFAGIATPSAQANTPDTPLKVRVQLKWFHQYQFAGFYAALEQGYFRRAGLDVELIEGHPEVDLARTVVDGGAEFGVGNSSLLIDFNQGLPVVAVAAIFQHSPFVILARVDPKIRTVKDLEGRTLMGESHSAELTAYLKKAGVDLAKVRQVIHSGSVKSLAANGPERVDATTAYISTEPVEASQYGIPYQIFNPRELNIDLYGDTLFTSQRFAREHPQAVAAMRDALAEGWRYAYRHQAEIIDLILEKYHPRMDRMTLTLEAQSLYNLFLADIVDIGYMSRTRWQEIARIFAETGLLPASYTLDGFLFTPDAPMPGWAYQALAWAALVLLFGGLLIAYIVSLNRRLRLSLAQLEAANAGLAELSTTDALTGLFNRRHFDAALDRELARATRHTQAIALLMIDVDEFKKYNDALGHPAGDACLRRIADILRDNAQRASEFAARIGGEEFAIVAGGLTPDEAFALAERIRREVADAGIVHPSRDDGRVSISIGVNCAPPDRVPLTARELIAGADAALYRAKREGRNRSILHTD